MPSTYTNSNGLEKIATGEQQDVWGESLRNDLDLIDQALDGVVTITLGTNTYTLAVDDGQLSNGRAKVIIFNGSPSGTVTVTITPSNIQKVYWVVNQTTVSLTLSNGAGTTLNIGPGTTSPAFCNGSGSVIGLQAGNNSFTSLDVAGSVNVQQNLNVAGATTLNAATVNSLNVGAQTIQALISSLIPAAASTLPGTMIIYDTYVEAVSSGLYVVFRFGGQNGTNVKIGFGFGQCGDGNQIPVPNGFNTTQMLFTCSLNFVQTTPGNQLDKIQVTNSGTTVTAKASDNSGNQYSVIANWMSIAWIQGASG